MAWYNPFSKKPVEVEEKLNPGQQYLGDRMESSREFTGRYETYYENLEIVNRAVNLVVDDAAAIATTVKPISVPGVVKGVKRAKVELLLTKEPNPYQDISTFRRNLITDFILDGNIFIYFDGAHLYHLPADNVKIHTDKDTYIEKFTYNDVDFAPTEIIHVKENSFHAKMNSIPVDRSSKSK